MRLGTADFVITIIVIDCIIASRSLTLYFVSDWGWGYYLMWLILWIALAGVALNTIFTIPAMTGEAAITCLLLANMVVVLMPVGAGVARVLIGVEELPVVSLWNNTTKSVANLWPFGSSHDEEAYTKNILTLLKQMSEHYDTVKSLPTDSEICCVIARQKNSDLPEGHYLWRQICVPVYECMVGIRAKKADKMAEAIVLKQELGKLGKAPKSCKELDEKFLKLYAKYEQFLLALTNIPELTNSLLPCEEYHRNLKRLAGEYESMHAEVRVICQHSLRSNK